MEVNEHARLELLDQSSSSDDDSSLSSVNFEKTYLEKLMSAILKCFLGLGKFDRSFT